MLIGLWAVQDGPEIVLVRFFFCLAVWIFSNPLALVLGRFWPRFGPCWALLGPFLAHNTAPWSWRGPSVGGNHSNYIHNPSRTPGNSQLQELNRTPNLSLSIPARNTQPRKTN